MSKYNLKEFLEDKLKEHKSTFKNTSYDDTNNRYLCSDETTLNVYDFDKYIKENFDKSKLPFAVEITSKEETGVTAVLY